MGIVSFFRQAFRDKTDRPAGRGKLHVYVHGSTTTHAPIFSDFAYTTPSPNPLTLDGNGNAPHWFLRPGVLVDVIVNDRLGKPIDSVIGLTANGSEDEVGGPFLPLAGEKRVTGWVAFDATVYGTLIDMRVFNLTQSGLELKTGTRIYGGGSLEIDSSVYMYDPRALTLSVDSLGSGPGGETPINSTHLVGRDPVTGLLVPVEADGPFRYFPRNFPEDAPPASPSLDTWYIASETPTGPWEDGPDLIWHYTAAETWENFVPFDGQQVLLGNRSLYRYAEFNTPHWQYYSTEGPVTRAFQTKVSAPEVRTPYISGVSGSSGWSLGDSYGLRLGDSAGQYGGLSQQGMGISRMFSDLLGNTETIIDVVGITITEPAATNFQQWLIGTDATGVFAGKDGQVACWTPANYPNPSYWLYFTPADGAMIRIGSTLYRKSGGTLVNFNLQGTTTNDSAPAGCVGERLSSVVPIGSHVSLTSGADKDVTSLTLGPGDWNVWGVVVVDPATVMSAADPRQYGSLSLTADTTDPVFAGWAPLWTGTGVGPTMVPLHRPVKVPAGSTNTVHLVAHMISSGALYVYGNLYAERVR